MLGKTFALPGGGDDHPGGHFYSVSPERMREEVARTLGENADAVIVYPLAAAVGALVELVDDELARLGIPPHERSPWL